MCNVIFFGKGVLHDRQITFIRVTDQLDNKDCRAVVTDGGVGYGYVTLEFHGSRRKGYKFILEIYAL